MEDRFKIGISTCLLGEKVRYDGGHKRDRYLTDTLGPHVEYLPVCPEVECGLPTPRESMHLWGSPESPRLLTTRSRIDLTDHMKQWAYRRVEELAKERLCGFIFKSRSPSSGMMRVKVYNEKTPPVKKGVGIFARIFMERFPLIPVEEEGRLQDPGIRENFIERIFTLKRWREALEDKRSPAGLIEFHTKHKLLILSHSSVHYRQMGKLVADGKKIPSGLLFPKYESLLMEALARKATVSKNVNVLQHLLGYFKKELSSDEKLEVIEMIDRYRGGDLPLVVPVTLINHFVRKYRQPYLEGQVYLHPHPVSLRLRNHA